MSSFKALRGNINLGHVLEPPTMHPPPTFHPHQKNRDELYILTPYRGVPPNTLQ